MTVAAHHDVWIRGGGYVRVRPFGAERRRALAALIPIADAASASMPIGRLASGCAAAPALSAYYAYVAEHGPPLELLATTSVWPVGAGGWTALRGDLDTIGDVYDGRWADFDRAVLVALLTLRAEAAADRSTPTPNPEDQ